MIENNQGLSPPENWPEWVRWLAQDADGGWWGYEAEPNLADGCWYENEVGRVVALGRGAANPEWRRSLRRRV